jgi:hypothetical protein
MKVKVIKQSTKKQWMVVQRVPFAPVIALARDKYLNPFEEGTYDHTRYDESCYAVESAVRQVFGDIATNKISSAYRAWAQTLYLRTFYTQHERIIWLNFLEQYCLTEKVVLECQVDINPFSDDYDNRLFKIKTSV